MAFKLTKGEQKQKADFQLELAKAREELDAKVEDVNDALQTAIDALMDAVADYNSALERARAFATDIVSQAEEDFSDKSERWQEGERGEICRAWIDEWEQLSLDDIELPDIDRIVIDAEDHADLLDQLPDEAE